MIKLSERQELELKYYFMNEWIGYETGEEYEDLSLGVWEELWLDFQEDCPEGISLPYSTLVFRTQ